MEFAVPTKVGKTARANDSFDQKEFFNAQLCLNNVRRRTWYGSAILGVGICCRKGRGVFSAWHTCRKRDRLFRSWFLCGTDGPRWTAFLATWIPSVLHGWSVRRLHDVFIV